jgi:hypothetical protein
MSVEENEDLDFDVRLWLSELGFSEPGMQKVAKNDITDKKCLTQLTTSDVTDLKLSVGDRRRLVNGLEVLQSPKKELPSASGGESTTGGDQQSSVNTDNVQVGVENVAKTSFSVDDVASFLAGTPPPSNVQASILDRNRQLGSQVLPPSTILSQTVPPVLPPALPSVNST